MTLSKAEKDAIGKLQGFCREYGYMAAGTLDHEYIYLYPKFNGGDPYIVPLNAVDYFLARNMPSATAISSATIPVKATGVSNASNVLPAAMSKRRIKSSSAQGLRLKNGMKGGGEKRYKTTYVTTYMTTKAPFSTAAQNTKTT